MTKFAFWQCLLGLLPQTIIAVRAYSIFPECRIVSKHLRCWNNVKKLSNYALWNAWGGLGAVLREQGDAILLNKYFGPRINAGFAVGSNLSGQTNMLSGSMVGAFSPAIFNAWGAGDYDLARRLAYRTCKIGTLFILVFAIPLALEVDEVLLLWLKNTPKYAAGFCLYVLAMNVIDKLAVGHALCVNANGEVACYQAFLGTSLVLTLPIAWVLLALGVSPYAVGMAMVATMIFCAIGRVWFARTLVGMSSIYWLKRIVLPITVLIVLIGALGWLPSLFMVPSFVRVCITTAIVEVALIPFSWYLILDEAERTFILSKLPRFLKK